MYASPAMERRSCISSGGKGISRVLLRPLLEHFLTKTDASIKSSVRSDRHSEMRNPETISNRSSTEYLCGTAATNCWYSCSDRILDFPCRADFTGSYIASTGTMIPLEWMHCKYQWNIIAHTDATSYQKSVGLMGLHQRLVASWICWNSFALLESFANLAIKAKGFGASNTKPLQMMKAYGSANPNTR